MFGAAGHDDPLYEAVSAGRKLQGYEHWLPFFHERLETLFDYLPGAPVLLDDQSAAARAARWAALADQYDARAAALAAKSKLGTVYKPVPPGELYLDDAAWDAAVGGRPLHQLAALPQPLGPGVIDAGGRIGRDFAPERQQEAISLFGALAAHVAARRRAGDVVIASYSAGARERLVGPPRRQRRHRRARHRPRVRPPRRRRPQPRGLAARARLRGAGPHGRSPSRTCSATG